MPTKMAPADLQTTTFTYTVLATEQAQHWLAALVASSSDAIIGLALDRTILSWNQAATRLLGYTAEQAIGQPITMLIPPELSAEYASLYSRLNAGEVISNIETVRLHQDGTRVPVFATISPIVGADGQQLGFSASLRDRSAQVRAAAEAQRLTADLRASQEFTNRILDVVPSVVYVRNLQSRENTFVNRSAATELGYTPEEIVAMGGELVRKLIHPDDFAQLAERERMFATLGDGETLDFEYRMRHRSGEWRWFLSREAIFQRDAAGKPQLVSGTATNITQFKQIEAALRQSEAALRSYYESTPILMGIVELVGADDILHVYDNPATCRFLGLAKHATSGRLSSALGVPPAAVRIWIEHYRECERTGQPVHFVYQHTNASASRWFSATVARIEQAHPDVPTRFCYVAEDITERKWAEDALRENEQRFRAVWEYSSDAKALSDAAGVMLAANPAYYRLYGYSAEEVLGQSFAIIFPPEQRTWAEEQYQAAFRMPVADGPIPIYESTVRRKDGTERIVESRVNFITTEGVRTAILSTVRDITERKRTEEALRYQSELTDTVLQNASSCMLMMDARGYCTYLNPAGEQMFGWSLAEIRQRPLHEMIHHHHPDGRPYPMDECPIDRALPENFDIREHEDVFIRRKGEFFPVLVAASPIFDARGRPVATVIEVQDITRRKQAEEERERLLASEQAARAQAEDATMRVARLQRLTSALAATLTAQQITDIVLGEGMDALGAYAGSMARLTDDEQLELIGARGFTEATLAAWQRFPVAVHAPIAEAVAQRTPIVLESLADWQSHYPELVDSARTEGYGAAVSVPLLLGERALGVFSIAFATDRTFSVHDRAFLTNLAQQGAQALERADLLAAKEHALGVAEEAVHVRDAFLAVAAHELKNPLAVLLGNAQLLERRLAPTQVLPERDLHGLSRITEQAQRLNQLISTMLDTARLESGQLEIEPAPCDLVDLLQQVLSDFRPTLIDHTLVWQPPSEAIPIHGDAMRLTQVFHNLISNALKYSPQGGTITVQLHEQAGQVCVAISDEGMGIAPEALLQVFQRFYRSEAAADQRIGGTGVGLFVVKEIISLHGGSVHAESQEGRGSTFTVCLPRIGAGGS